MSLAALAALGAIPGVAKAGLGVAQLIQANKYAKTTRPTYKRPEEIEQATELARRQAAQTELPGEALLRNRLSGKLAEGVSALKNVGDSPIDVMAGVTSMVGQQNRVLSDTAVQAEEMRQNNIARFQQALSVEAGYTDKEFQVNKYEPYLNAMKASAMLNNAGTQNVAGGLDSAASGAFSAVGNQKYLDTLKSQMTMWESIKASQNPSSVQQSQGYQSPYIYNPNPWDVPNMNPFGN